MGRGSRSGWLKILGLAGLLGAVAAGAVLVNRRRTWREYEPEELRRRLHARLDARG
jgi:hypothetical protein